MHFDLTQILTWSLLSWEHRSQSSQKSAEHVLKLICALETLAELDYSLLGRRHLAQVELMTALPARLR
jgi:hypothetical protein